MRLLKDYKYNSFPNRKVRRERAKVVGVFGIPGAWKSIVNRLENVQTVQKVDKRK